ncbi:hypothetical protein HN682_08075 [Candidatus Peregrinibacteria bacterium]|jgi:hypothetical protein|nr:hypothetical protein [Candidatus Peregrinibacteria bacterium]
MAGKDPKYMSRLVLKNGGVMETEAGTEIVSVDSTGTPSIKANIEDSLADGKIYIGSAAGVTSEVDMSGDVTIVNSGATTIGAGKVTTNELEGLAAGEFFIGDDGTPANNAKVTMTGDVTMDKTGFTVIGNQNFKSLTLNLTAADIKGMAAAPFEMLPAPGAGQGYVFMGASLYLVAGSEVLTEAGDNMAFRYTDGSGVIVSETIESTGFIDNAADIFTNAIPVKDTIVAKTGIENQALVLDNTGGAEFAGNASNDAELRVTVYYAQRPI